MSALTRLAVLLAALAGVGVIVWLFVLRDTPTVPEIPMAKPPSATVVRDQPEVLPGRLPTPQQGGVVAGRVLGEERPWRAHASCSFATTPGTPPRSGATASSSSGTGSPIPR